MILLLLVIAEDIMDIGKIKKELIESIEEIFKEGMKSLPEISGALTPLGGVCQFDSHTAIEVAVRLQLKIDRQIIGDDPLMLFVTKEKNRALSIDEIAMNIQKKCEEQGE